MASWTDRVGSETESTLRKPDGFGSLEELTGYLRSAARPFVLISERELSVLRRGLTKQGWKRALYLQPAEDGEYTGGLLFGDGILARANQWLERPIEIPGKGGHYHHFFCDDGTRLEIPSGLKVQAEGYKCPACGRVYTGEKYDNAVRWFQNHWMSQGALCQALVYGIEKDREYAAKAVEILKGYAEKYPEPRTSATEGGQMYQSLCETLWIIRLAQAYDLVYHSSALNDEDRRLIEQKLLRQCAQGLMNVGAQGNWGSWHLSAVGIIGLTLKDAALTSYALEKFKAQMQDELGEDGLWPESVHTYHFMPLRAFVLLAEACHRAGIDLYNWEASPGKSLKAMFTSPVYFAYPSLQIPAINDGWYYSFLPLELYEVAFRRWGSPLFAWTLKTGYRFGENPINSAQEEHLNLFKRCSFYAFLFGRDLPGRVPSPVTVSSNFTSLGICTLRSGSTMLTFDYGPFLSHGQRDKMGITVYHDDKILVPDYGTPGYGSKILPYYKNTTSHNTVVVDGKPQEATKESKLLEFRAGDLLQLAEAETKEAYPGVTHMRRVIMVGSSYFVYDRLTAENAHTYDWILHGEGRFSATQGLSGTGTADINYEYAEDIKPLGKGSSFDAVWSSDGSVLSLHMWLDEAGEYISCKFPAETGARKSDTLIVRREGKSAEYLTLLCPGSGETQNKCEVEDGIIKITSGKSTYWIYLEGMPGVQPSAKAKMKSDASAAVVETVEDVPVRCAFLQGKEIIWQKEVLVESSDKLDHFEAQLQSRSPVISCTGSSTGFLKLRSSCRAMRLNGHRVSASNTDGIAVLRLLPKNPPAGAGLSR